MRNSKQRRYLWHFTAFRSKSRKLLTALSVLPYKQEVIDNSLRNRIKQLNSVDASISCGNGPTKLPLEGMLMKQSRKEDSTDLLKGWQQIAEFLGQPASVAERWAHEGMPVERKGRFVYASREKLSQWLGRESAGEPVHISTESTDLSSELKRGLSFARTSRGKRKSKAA